MDWGETRLCPLSWSENSPLKITAELPKPTHADPVLLLSPASRTSIPQTSTFLPLEKPI